MHPHSSSLRAQLEAFVEEIKQCTGSLEGVRFAHAVAVLTEEMEETQATLICPLDDDLLSSPSPTQRVEEGPNADILRALAMLEESTGYVATAPIPAT